MNMKKLISWVVDGFPFLYLAAGLTKISFNKGMLIFSLKLLVFIMDYIFLYALLWLAFYLSRDTGYDETCKKMDRNPLVPFVTHRLYTKLISGTEPEKIQAFFDNYDDGLLIKAYRERQARLGLESVVG